MSRRLQLVLVLVAVASGGLGSALAADESFPLDKPLVADLDGDGTNEIVSALETQCFTNDGPKPPPCEHGGLRSLYVTVEDACTSQAVELKLSREMDLVSLAEVVDADGDGAKDDVAFEARAGATSRGVQAKVVRFRADSNGCISVQKTLFSYPRPETIGRRPKGTFFRTGYLSIHDFDKGIKGLELRTEETYSRATDPGCCPSFSRTTFWRYVATTSRYKSYRTKLRKIAKPI